MKKHHNLYLFSKKLIDILNYINNDNIIIASIDPGVSLGLSIFALENINSDNLKFKILLSLQKKFNKQLDSTGQDIRIQSITCFIYEILLKYQVKLVILEQSNYSIGKFSYAENLLARYTGAIYSLIKSLEIHILDISYKLMQKLVLAKSIQHKDKKAVMVKLLQLNTINIKQSEYDKSDSLGYGYAIYNCLKFYAKNNSY